MASTERGFSFVLEGRMKAEENHLDLDLNADIQRHRVESMQSN